MYTFLIIKMFLLSVPAVLLFNCCCNKNKLRLPICPVALGGVVAQGLLISETWSNKLLHLHSGLCL